MKNSTHSRVLLSAITILLMAIPSVHASRVFESQISNLEQITRAVKTNRPFIHFSQGTSDTFHQMERRLSPEKACVLCSVKNPDSKKIVENFLMHYPGQLLDVHGETIVYEKFRWVESGANFKKHFFREHSGRSEHFAWFDYPQFQTLREFNKNIFGQ